MGEFSSYLLLLSASKGTAGLCVIREDRKDLDQYKIEETVDLPHGTRNRLFQADQGPVDVRVMTIEAKCKAEQ